MPRSIYAVTATEPVDFFEEYWQTQEYAGELSIRRYDDWFCEDYDACDGDRENDAGDDEDRNEDADEDDDEQIFRLGVDSSPTNNRAYEKTRTAYTQPSQPTVFGEDSDQCCEPCAVSY